jgi:hypothetical protein
LVIRIGRGISRLLSLYQESPCIGALILALGTCQVSYPSIEPRSNTRKTHHRFKVTPLVELAAFFRTVLANESRPVEVEATLKFNDPRIKVEPVKFA